MKKFYDNGWRHNAWTLFRIAVVIFFIWMLAIMFTSCRSTEHIIRTDRISASDSIALLHTSAGSSLFSSQLSQMDGTWQITYYDTSLPIDPDTGHAPILATASGSYSRRDSTQVHQQDSAFTDKEVFVHQDQTEHIVDSLASYTGSSGGSSLQRISTLFISLSILIFVILIAYIIFRIIR